MNPVYENPWHRILQSLEGQHMSSIRVLCTYWQTTPWFRAPQRTQEISRNQGWRAPEKNRQPAGKGKPEPKPLRRRDSSRLRRANRAGRRIHLYRHSWNVAFMPQESNGERLDSSSDRRRWCGPYAPMEERSAAARASVQCSTSPSCSASTITRATGSVPE